MTSKKKIFFQSSLPRSGSTLLQNIVGQRPDFYVTPTSGVLELLYGARANFTTSPEFKAQDSELMKNGFCGFCRGGMEGFFENLTDKPYVMDKSRGWGVHYSFLNQFYSEPKVVCMVRDLRDIFASMEKNFRNNQHLDSGWVNHAEMIGTTTEKRIDLWSRTQPVGLAMERLHQMIREGVDRKVLFVRYEDLTENPQREMNRVYSYLEVEPFLHDFENVKQVTREDDSIYGPFGNHQIRNQVKKVPSEAVEVLGKHACDWIRGHYDWYYQEFGYS